MHAIQQVQQQLHDVAEQQAGGVDVEAHESGLRYAMSLVSALRGRAAVDMPDRSRQEPFFAQHAASSDGPCGCVPLPALTPPAPRS